MVRREIGNSGRNIYPSSFEVRKGELKISVDETGGWLNSFSYQGKDILFPRFIVNPSREVGERIKYKGGMHVCLPQFGGEATFGLPQHGFGRDQKWRLIFRDSESVYMHLDSQPAVGSYPSGLEAVLTYTLQTDEQLPGLVTQLEVINSGQEPMPIAPALHPYFGLRGKVSLFGPDGLEEHRDIEKFQEATMRVLPGEFAVDFGDGMVILLSSQEMTDYYFWTNNPSRYLCIEPTTLGANFDAEAGRVIIAPGETRHYAFGIHILQQS